MSEVRAQVSDEEWQIRVDLAAAYRLVAMFGWDDLVFTHLTARVPGPERHFLINQSFSSTRNFMCRHSVSASVSVQMAI